MNPTQEFDTALKGLTPDERATYTTANPIVNVGGVNQALGSMGLQAITSQSLQPVRPYTIPEVPNTSVAPGIIQSGLSSSASITAQNEAERKRQEEIATKQAEQETVKGGLAGIMQKLGLQGERTVQAQEQAGIPQLQKDLDEITSQIESKELAARRQIENLDKTFTGTSAGKQDAIRAIEKNSAREIADLSIIQNARNRNLLTAQSLVNQKIELETEDLKNRFTYLKFFYDENKEFLTKQDERDFQAAIKKADREYEEQKFSFTLLENARMDLLFSASEQGATNGELDLIANSKSMGELLKNGSKYAGDRLDREYKQAQINKMNREANTALNTLPPTTQIRVQTIAGQFDNEQAVKAYQTSAEAIDALRTAGTSPTDDISRVYAFAKVMDPNSVVREGEYKTVQDYSTALIERAGLKAKRVFDNAGFLTEEARTFMKTTLDNRLASSRKAYDNIYSEYGRRINKVTGGTDGTDYITDYARAFDTPTPKTVKDYVMQNPDKAEMAKQIITENPTLSDEDVIQILMQ